MDPSIESVGPDSLEIGSELISLVCITVLALALGSKTYRQNRKNLNYARLLVILLYLLSWAFATTSIILVSTNNNNIVSCTLGMLTCDVFYAGSKIAIYAWLIERVYLVSPNQPGRFKSCQYRFHMLLLCPYIVIFALMLSFKNINIEQDGKCMIGLKNIASIPLLVYDFAFNLYLTGLFMYPLINVGRSAREDWKDSRLYMLAKRTFVASVVCLLVSFVNVLVVVLTQGHERGLVCLTMCTVDVTVNVVTVHWVTTNKTKGDSGQGDARTSVDHTASEMTFNPNQHELGNAMSLKSRSEQDTHEHEDDGSSVRSAHQSHLSAKPLKQGYE